jgi:hypothetical protein
LWLRNRVDEKGLHAAICDYVRSSNREYEKDKDGPLFSEMYSKKYKEALDAVTTFAKEHGWKKSAKDSYVVLKRDGQEPKKDVSKWHKLYITLQKTSSKDFFPNLTGELKTLTKAIASVDDDVEIHIVNSFRLLYTEVDNVKILYKDAEHRDRIKALIFSKISTEDRSTHHRTDDGVDFEDKTDTEHVADEVIEKIKANKKKWKDIIDDGYEGNDDQVKKAFLKIVHDVSEKPEHRELF